MKVPSEVTIWLAMEPIDFRRSIDGLAAALGNALGRDPMSGEVFLFRNRRRTSLKALYWSRNGFVLLYKRLERGRLQCPRPSTEAADIEVAASHLQELLDGWSLDLKNEVYRS